MKLRFTQGVIIAAMAAGVSLPALAADQTRAQDQTKVQDQDIYGSQLMTVQERNEHRSKMRAAKTAQERERVRTEHHEQMKVRAKERGITLPDQPPAGRGPGMGPGGGGMGPGGGR
jgi:Flp pilus assembly protein TadD